MVPVMSEEAAVRREVVHFTSVVLEHQVSVVGQ